MAILSRSLAQVYAAEPLICQGCIPEAVAHDESAFRERGLDDFVHQLGARGAQQERLGFRRHVPERVDQQLA